MQRLIASCLGKNNQNGRAYPANDGGDLPWWPVDIPRAHAEHLGIIVAKGGEEAVAKPAELFNIPPERRNRITVADRTVMVVVD